MQSVDPTTLLLQLGILLSVAYLLGRLAERVGLPSTTGELAAGLLLGPSLLGAVASANGRAWLFLPADGRIESLRAVAVFCGVLLIGVAGATLNVSVVRARRWTIAWTSLGALGLPLAATVLLALLADSRLRGPAADLWSFAAFAGLALSVSAVPVIVKIFADLKVLHRDLSQLSLSVAVVDDATVWVGLSCIAAFIGLQRGGGLAAVPAHGAAVGAAALLLALLTMVAVRARTSALQDTGDSTDSGDIARGRPATGAAAPWSLLAAGFITLGAVVTAGVGLDFTLGAFVCGMVVASGRIVPVPMLRPLRTVVLGALAPLFLAVNGLSADLRALADPRLAAVALITILLAVVTKTLGAYGGGRLAGLPHDSAMVLGSALNARGTVQLVIAGAGLRLGLITTEGFTILVLVALVTSAMAGPLINRYLKRIPETPEERARLRLVD